MKRLLLALLYTLAIIAVVICLTGTASAQVAAYAVLRPPCDSGAVARVAESMAGRVTGYGCTARGGVIAFRFPIDTVIATDVLARLRGALRASGDSAVRVAEYDETTSVPQASDDAALASWGLDSMRVAGAWSQGVTGGGAVIGVLDTGFDPAHPEFAGRVDWAGSSTGSIDSTAGASLQTTSTCKHHGSHVAGTAAGATRGMCPACRIYLVRVAELLNGGCAAWSSAQTLGAQFLIARGVDVVSTSMGGSWSGSYQAVANQARQAGVILVGAAGNNGSYVFCPACYDDAIGVGGLTSSLVRGSYSNRGPELDFAAPGSSISAAIGASTFATKTGTSMAQPHIAGLVALMRSADPSLSFDQVYELLRQCSLDLSTPGFDNNTGWGMPRADRCVALARGASLQPTTADTPVRVGPPFPVVGCRAVASPAAWSVGDHPAWLTLTTTTSQVCYRVASDPGLAAGDVITIDLIGVP